MAYEGSLTHFIRSVYEGTTAKEGFVVNLIKTVPYKDINLYIPAFTDTTSIYSAPALTKYIESLYKTKDSIQAALQINKVQQWLAALRNRMPFVISLDTGKGIQAYFF